VTSAPDSSRCSTQPARPAKNAWAAVVTASSPSRLDTQRSTPASTALCRTTTGCYDEDSSLVFGTKGLANVKACRITGKKNWRWTGKCDPYQVEHTRLFAAIRAGKPINNGDYMVRSTLFGIMGQISCYTGKEVTWEQINGSNFSYGPKPEECRDGMEPPVKPGADGSYPVYLPGQTRLL
jgi:hypothetical protein